MTTPAEPGQEKELGVRDIVNAVMQYGGEARATAAVALALVDIAEALAGAKWEQPPEARSVGLASYTCPRCGFTLAVGTDDRTYTYGLFNRFAADVRDHEDTCYVLNNGGAE